MQVVSSVRSLLSESTYPPLRSLASVQSVVIVACREFKPRPIRQRGVFFDSTQPLMRAAVQLANAYCS